MPAYQVQRSVNIDASPEKVFEVVSDYNTWTNWSPWLCIEPQADVNVSDDSASEGSVYSWNGELVGQGEIEHKKLRPASRVEDELRFVRPFKSVAYTDFELTPDAGGTRLTWDMRGNLPWYMFWMKSMMQSFIGMDYERGLRMLKEWIETGQVLSRTSVHGIQAIGPMQVIGVRRTCLTQEVGPVMQQAIEEAEQKLQAHSLATDTEVASIYHRFDLKRQTFDFTCGHLMPQKVEDVPSDLSSWSIPEVQALRVDHFGSYDHLGNAWNAAHRYAQHNKLKQSKAGPFELYKNDPMHTPPADILTEIYLPLR